MQDFFHIPWLEAIFEPLLPPPESRHNITAMVSLRPPTAGRHAEPQRFSPSGWAWRVYAVVQMALAVADNMCWLFGGSYGDSYGDSYGGSYDD